ncbi:DUF4405 domain-containing protein [Alteromonas aestuariivivens]|uniref:DUF4405 domain-containing protein n=1 Tax=Alteromonas aestuariivivens TaxID=1938339 RepID=A0A3D8M3M9_9ALTE|nr:DUF4405 domain-containing protein [Alteromonas aestuariivivens]RDV24299.1 DUF4405 domain-containing protein [Alteromonas aestuariivivens]
MTNPVSRWFNRVWATPLLTGAFLLSGITGVMLFFHLNTPLNKLAHEYLSWVLLFAAACHVGANFRAFLQHLKRPLGQSLVAAFGLLLAASFYSKSEGPRDPAAPAIRTLSSIPLSELARLSGQSHQQVADIMAGMGYEIDSLEQPLEEFTGPGIKKQTQALARILPHSNNKPGSGED